ncbi:MAG TPA: glycoside hydrolase family 16 protein [Candidatus Limnocylindrales bacterium]|nr:glycoside hydrolase family 16 protein [Candidatus Limnocylindrales bacterium]
MRRRSVVALAMVTAVAGSAAFAAPVSAARPGPGSPRTVVFDGYTWTVKTSTRKIGPGPNLFSPDLAWVDSSGALHLRIAKLGGRWNVSEVINQATLGYGTYSWTVKADLDSLDPQVVLGLFTWNDDPAYNHRELDVEFARWGNAADPTNGQFVVQPYDRLGNLQRITQQRGLATTTHGFTWRPDKVDFFSSASPTSWSYSGPDVPRPGGENARMNLWLFRGVAPSNGQPAEVVISDFTFTPLP